MPTIHVPPGPLDNHLKSYRDPGTCFRLEPGVYTTQGAFAFDDFDLCMLAPGCSLIGAPDGGTIIKPANPRTSFKGHPTGYYEALTGGSRLAEVGSDSLTIRDLSLQLPDLGFPVVGIHAWSSSVQIHNVRVTGVYGSRQYTGPVKEGFGILINGSPSSHIDGGHQVENCRVEMRHTVSQNYSTGIYVGVVRRPGVSTLYSYVRACSVATDIDTLGHAAYAANSLTRIEDCEAHNCVRAFFVDTGLVDNVIIDGLCAHGIEWGIDLRVAALGHHRRNILIDNSQFYFRAVGDGWVQAVLAADETGNASTDICEIDIVDSKFVAPETGKASKGRCCGMVRRVSEHRCRWIGNWEDPVLQEGALPWEVR